MENKATRLTLCILLVSFVAWGQKQEENLSVAASAEGSDTKVLLQRKITLDGTSKAEEVILNVERAVNRFELNVNSSVITGELKVEFYDPNGKNQGTFSVGTQLDAGKSEMVDSNIQKSLEGPQSGVWKVKIIPTEATGTVTIQTASFY